MNGWRSAAPGLSARRVDAVLVAHRIAEVGAVELRSLRRTVAGAALVDSPGRQGGGMGRTDLILVGGLEGDHDAVAGPRRLAVVRLADADARCAGLRSVERPAAVGLAPFIAEGAEHLVEEGQGGLHVLGADGCISE